MSILEDALSLERFGRYLAWAGGDRSAAIELYTLNTRISESLYTPLQMLEVALRNRIHRVLAEMRGEDWMLHACNLFGDHQPRQVAEAIDHIARAGRDPIASRVVAALSLGFWTAMFGRAYEETWREGLYRIARREDGKHLRRKDLSTPLMRIRELRNRIAHHEPVIHWDLYKTNNQLMQILHWLSPPAARWCEAHSRFAHVCPVALHDYLTPTPTSAPTPQTADLSATAPATNPA
ncbi:Abi family protein [Lysobacter sp. KIS68-7]|uniref:Abi family protein n=1 Tax=Lysobacter sp. KIS68-7 TaxID=2904252 RepID=UPI001E5A2F0F|nr:Abi family protein [Lysobacter sp. KIS68-7]UHQ19585.1 Abi family protein [Lysobacter sp. KIS68-7]